MTTIANEKKLLAVCMILKRPPISCLALESFTVALKGELHQDQYLDEELPIHSFALMHSDPRILLMNESTCLVIDVNWKLSPCAHFRSWCFPVVPSLGLEVEFCLLRAGPFWCLLTIYPVFRLFLCWNSALLGIWKYEMFQPYAFARICISLTALLPCFII